MYWERTADDAAGKREEWLKYSLLTKHFLPRFFVKSDKLIGPHGGFLILH